MKLTQYFKGEVPKEVLVTPFSYRILVPWIVSFLPLKISIGFGMVNIAVTYLSLIMLYLLLKEWKFDDNDSFVGTLLYLVSFPMFWYSSAPLVDNMAMLFIIVSLYFFVRNKLHYSMIAASIGVLAKETTIVLVVLLLIHNYKKIYWSILPISALIFPRILFSNGVGFLWNPHFDSLFSIKTYASATLAAIPLVPLAWYGRKKANTFMKKILAAFILIPLSAFFLVVFRARFIWIIYPALIPMALYGLERIKRYREIKNKWL